MKKDNEPEFKIIEIDDPNFVPIKYNSFHKKPKTRREFIAQGYMAAISTVAVPSIFSVISQVARGEGCAPPAKNAALPPFAAFDLNGGANIAGHNLIVGKRGGIKDYLASYTTIGLSNAQSPKTSEANVIALNGDINNSILFHKLSGFYKGFASVTTAATRANMDGVLFCTASLDDTSGNPHNPTYWINKCGLDGSLIPIAGGARNPPAASINPLKKPIGLANADAVLGLVDLGKMASLLNVEKAEKIMKAVSSMSSSHLAAFNQKQLPDKIKELVDCGYINSSDLITQFSADQLDPRKDPIMTKVFGTAVDKGGAAITKLVLDGFAGVGNFGVGRCDYHNNTFSSDGIDGGAGAAAGRICEAAAAKGVPAVLYFYTDGGVSSNGSGAAGGRFPWTADDGLRSAAFMLIYSPKGKPKLRNNLRQVGAYTDGGSIDRGASPISNSVPNLTKLIVANYLALLGKEGDLAKIVGDNPFGAGLEKLLSFSKDTLG